MYDKFNNNYMKEVGKPYNAADARHVNYPQVWGTVSLSALVVSDGVSCQCVYTSRVYEALRYLSRFCSSFEINF